MRLPFSLTVPALALCAAPAAAQAPTLTDVALAVMPVEDTGEAQLGNGRFVQLWTDEPGTFARRWAGEAPLAVETARSARRGEMLQMFIAVDGCQRDRRGACYLQGSFQLRKPDGSPDGDPIDFVAWQGAAPAKGTLGLSAASIGAFIEAGDPAGDYTATLTITDVVARQSGTSTVTLTFTD